MQNNMNENMQNMQSKMQNNLCQYVKLYVEYAYHDIKNNWVGASFIRHRPAGPAFVPSP
jgi:hypothetical protein